MMASTRTFKRVEEVLDLKLDFLSEYDTSVQTISIEIYKELSTIVEKNKFDIPESLTNKLQNVFDRLNEETKKSLNLRESHSKISDDLKNQISNLESILAQKTSLGDNSHQDETFTATPTDNSRNNENAEENGADLLNAAPLDITSSSSQQPATHPSVPGCNLYIVGDSHSRELGKIIKPLLVSSSSVNCVVHPGRKLDFIVNSIKPNKIPPNTEICLIGGTNDLFCTRFDSIKNSFELLHNKCQNHKVLVVLVPPRFDKRGLNSHIRNLNVKIKHCINSFENFQCLDPATVIQRTHFNNDQVHLNRKGKEILCSKVVNKLFGLSIPNANVNNNGNNQTRNKRSSRGRKTDRNKNLPPRLRNRNQSTVRSRSRNDYRRDTRRVPNQQDYQHTNSEPPHQPLGTSYPPPPTHLPPHPYLPYYYTPSHPSFFTHPLLPSFLPPPSHSYGGHPIPSHLQLHHGYSQQPPPPPLPPPPHYLPTGPGAPVPSAPLPFYHDNNNMQSNSYYCDTTNLGNIGTNFR
uniref:Uncharacterized protein n=1 Tax=Cacopsylla melanoneura TaxID=428564 RepID=A0A8D9E4C4_9HEMI